MEDSPPPPSPGRRPPVFSLLKAAQPISEITAGVLIAVDRPSKHWLRAAESGGVSLRLKAAGFTPATLVDKLLCPQSPTV